MRMIGIAVILNTDTLIEYICNHQEIDNIETVLRLRWSTQNNNSCKSGCIHLWKCINATGQQFLHLLVSGWTCLYWSMNWEKLIFLAVSWVHTVSLSPTCMNTWLETSLILTVQNNTANWELPHSFLGTYRHFLFQQYRIT